MNRRSFFGNLASAIVAAGVVLRSESLFGAPPAVVDDLFKREVPLEFHIESIDRERGVITFVEPVVMTEERIEELTVVYQRLRTDPTYLAHLEESV